MQGDGNGWTQGPDGSRYWGRYGAAGLLVRSPTPHGPVVLVQHRAPWSHHGGTWGLPGGARDSHESAVQAALREAREETGLAEDVVTVRTEREATTVGTDWTYTTVIADTATPVEVAPDAESTELRWVAEDEVGSLPLHPGLRASWPWLRARRVRLLLDTANVLGSRPDGWWRDRAGATARLLTQVVAALPRTAVTPAGFVWIEGVDAVLEGAARGVDVAGVVAHRAAGSGDDELVRVAAVSHLVVTADRGLVARLPQREIMGPGEVLRWLRPPPEG